MPTTVATLEAELAALLAPAAAPAPATAEDLAAVAELDADVIALAAGGASATF